MKVTVTIVRHGETAENKARIVQGHLDTKLNELGLQQAIDTGKYFERVGQKFDFCFSSDLQRAQKTGELIMEQLSEPKHVQTDQRIRENFLGSLQGLSWDAKRSARSNVDDFGAEPVEHLKARLCDFWDYLFPSTPGSVTPLASAPDFDDVKVLITTHGGPVRHLVISSLVMDRRYSVQPELSQNLKRGVPEFIARRVGNCCISTVRMESRADGSWDGSVLEYASERHLKPEDIDLNETNADSVAISSL
ncbi:phosphoglycerate mutase-like protein [Atractiella rhizophila]|nr:phosphoglycerate mutase-like protein [Atractiella rhizophila]